MTDLSVRDERIKELETELRLLDTIVYVKTRNGSGPHVRHKAKRRRIVKELEELYRAQETKETTLIDKIKAAYRRFVNEI